MPGATYYMLKIARDLAVQGDLDQLKQSGMNDDAIAFLMTLTENQMLRLDEDDSNLFDAKIDIDALRKLNKSK